MNINWKNFANDFNFPAWIVPTKCPKFNQKCQIGAKNLTLFYMGGGQIDPPLLNQWRRPEMGWIMVTMFLATYKRPGKSIFVVFFQKMLKILRRHFYSKKVKIEKNWATGMLCTSNESWEHVQFIFRYKK